MDDAAVQSDDLEALALYSIFWYADQPENESSFSEEELTTLGLELRQRVQVVWDKLFPGKVAEAYRWIFDRIDHFTKASLITPEAAPVIRDHVAAAMSPSYCRPTKSPLVGLWRIHVLYQLLLQAIETGDLPAYIRPRIRRVLNQQAFTAASSADWHHAISGGSAGQFSAAVLNRSRDLVGELLGTGIITEDQSAALGVTPLPTSIEPSQGVCTVCGDPLSKWPVVVCNSCSTPHHRDCWGFNKGCATFSCGCLDVQGQVGGPGHRPNYDLNSTNTQEALPPVRAAELYWGFLGLLGMVSLFWGTVGILSFLLGLPFSSWSPRR